MNVNGSDSENISELLIVIVMKVHDDKGGGDDVNKDRGGQWLWQ